MLLTVTVAYAALFGLCLGSFANVIIYRLPRGESIVRPPSHCPACSKRLSVADLIPLLSWLFLRGRCRYCSGSISVRYPLVEVLCTLLFTCMALYTGPCLDVVPLCLLAFVLLCVSFIDMDTQEIPDELLVFGAVVGGLWVVMSCFAPLGAPSLLDALLGALAGAVPLYIADRLTLLFVGKDGFGFGDVKLMAVAGLFLGWQLAFVSLFFAIIAGGVFGGALMLTHRAERGSYMAFGPFLAAGVVAAIWFGHTFIALLFRNIMVE